MLGREQAPVARAERDLPDVTYAELLAPSMRDKAQQSKPLTHKQRRVDSPSTGATPNRMKEDTRNDRRRRTGCGSK